jgi:tRNA uridine 5-carboxymethylaminomethyl modification enzyme
VSPEEINSFLEKEGTNDIKQKVKAITIASRPQVEIGTLLKFVKGGLDLNVVKSVRFKEISESAEIRIKYEGYILREKMVADKIKRLENLKIPEDIDYSELVSISTEGRQKLARIKPANIGQAGRISGVSPSDVNILLMYIGR